MTSILHLSKYYPPEWGGTEQANQSIAAGTAARGKTNVVIAFTKYDDLNENVDGVQVLRRKNNLIISSQPISISWLWEAIRRIRKYDIVVYHSANYLGALVLLLITPRQKLITCWHMDVVGKGLLKTLVKPLEDFVLRRSAVILANSQQYAEGSPPLRPFMSKVRLLINGIKDPLEHDTRTAAPMLPASVREFAGDRPIALSIGRLVPYKGFDQLIISAGYSGPEVVNVIVGDGPMRQQLTDLIGEQNVADRVMLAGRLSTEDLTAMLSHARLYVMPSNSRNESFGMVQLEAMSHSLPIVVTDLPGSGVAWVADFGKLGAMVPINDPKALGEAVRSVAFSPDHAEYAARSRARFEDMFTEEKMVERFMDVLDAVQRPDGVVNLS